jgi:uncharacterized membrane protein (Fun14 family)
MEAVPQQQPQPVTWLDTIRNKIADYPVWLTDIMVYGLCGVALGFVAKKMGKLFFWALVFMLILIILAHYANSQIINVVLLKQFLNISSVTSLDSFFQHLILLVQLHLTETLSLLVGFCIGLYLG